MNNEQRLTFRIHGMDCVEEIASLKRELSPLVDSVDQLAFDILNGKLIVDGAQNKVSAAAVIQLVARAGMRAETWQDETLRRGSTGAWQQHGRSLLALTAALFAAAGLLTQAWLAGGIMGNWDC